MSEYMRTHPAEVCKHGNLVVRCLECLDAYRSAENKRWINKQRAIKAAYQNAVEAQNLYTAICSDPIECEQYH